MESYVVHCHSCGAANRVPAEKEGVEGRCGACGATLAAVYHRPVPLSDVTFEPFLRKYPGPVLAEFWAPW